MNKYQRKLNMILNKRYTEAQIELFEWGVDTEDDKHYAYNFTDHTGTKYTLKLVKSSGFAAQVRRYE